MKKIINIKPNSKEVTNLFVFIDKIDNPKEQVEIEIESNFDLLKAHNENFEYLCKYGVSKFYLNDNNNLCERTEDSPEVIEAINNNIIKQRQARYQAEVDPLTLEYMRTGDEALKTKANKLVEQIKKELPKKEIN